MLPVARMEDFVFCLQNLNIGKTWVGTIRYQITYLE